MAFVPVVLSLIGPIDDHNDDDDSEHGCKGGASSYSSRRGSGAMVSVGAQTANVHSQHWHGEDGDSEEFHTPSKQNSGKWKDGAPRLL